MNAVVELDQTDRQTDGSQHWLTASIVYVGPSCLRPQRIPVPRRCCPLASQFEFTQDDTDGHQTDALL